VKSGAPEGQAVAAPLVAPVTTIIQLKMFSLVQLTLVFSFKTFFPFLMTALDILRFMAITQNKCLLWSSFNEISVYFVNCIDHPFSAISPLDYGYDLSHKKESFHRSPGNT
jgi:hypothetical protein